VDRTDTSEAVNLRHTATSSVIACRRRPGVQHADLRNSRTTRSTVGVRDAETTLIGSCRVSGPETAAGGVLRGTYADRVVSTGGDAS